MPTFATLPKRQFRVISTALGRESEEYVEIMQDVHVDKTGLFTLIDEKRTVDPNTGDVVATVRFIERLEDPGPDTEILGDFEAEPDDGLY